MIELKVTTNKLNEQGSTPGYINLTITKSELEELVFNKLKEERTSEAHTVIDIKIVNNKKQISFEEVSEAGMDWLQNNSNPHAKIIIDINSAELVEGNKVYNR